MRYAIHRVLLVAVAAVTLLAPSGTAGAQSANGTSVPQADTTYEKTVDLVQPAVVRLQVDWHAYVDTGANDFGKVGPYDFTGSCSGFIVSPTGYIVTAGHCVDATLEGIGTDVLTALLQDMVTAGYLTTTDLQDQTVLEHIVQNWHVEGEAANSPADATVTVAHGISLSGKGDLEGGPARVIEQNPPSKGDVALLKVEASDLPTILLADPTSVTVGTSVLAVGYPATSDQVTDPTMTATFKDGKVSSKKTREGGLLPVYEVSAALSKGMSGGPTVTLDGKVIGLNSFYPADETQPFNFLSPTSLINETLTRNGVKNELGPVDQLYRQGLDAYFAGDYSTAQRRFASVLDQLPWHQQAQELKTLAVAKAAASPTTTPTTTGTADTASSKTPLVIAGGALAAVLLLAALALVVLGRRRKAGAASGAGPVGTTTMPVGAFPAQYPPIAQGPPMPVSPMPPAPMTGPPMAAPPVPPAPMTGPPMAAPPVPPAPMAVNEPIGITVPDAFCSHCGHGVSLDDRFCPSCGNDLHHIAPPSTLA